MNPLNDQVKQERAFLHDMASPLMVAIWMVEAVEMTVDPNDVESKAKLAKAMKSLLKMTDLLKARRKVLIALDQETSQ